MKFLTWPYSIKSRLQTTAVQQYGALLRKYLAPQWFRVCCMTALLFTTLALQLIGPQIIRVFVEAVQRQADMAVLTGIALLFFLAMIGSRLCSAWTSYVCENVSWYATNRLRADLTFHCLKLDRSFHSQHTPGELIERVDGDVSALAGFLSDFVVRIVASMLLLLGTLLLIARESLLLGTLLAVYMAFTMFLFVRFQALATPSFKARRQAEAELSGFFGETLTGIEDIAALGAQGYTLQRFFALQRSSINATIKSNYFWSSYEGIWIVVLTLSSLIVLVICYYAFVSGSMSLAVVIMIVSYEAQMLNYSSEITDQLDGLQQTAGALERINELYHTTNRVKDGSGATLPHTATRIELEHISFYYEPEQPVLTDLTLTIAAGEVLGVIGRSGSGKTTLTRLLMRFYDPIAGSIKFAGQDLRDFKLDELRQSIGLVTQEVQLFQATLRDNLTFFNNTISDQRILEAIQLLGLQEWYERLPSGLMTELQANGGGLSAGEAQLVACIRVFLKDPHFIILDEASSRLDPATEAFIVQSTQRLLEGRTGIIIAHRLSTIEKVDNILVLEEGRCVEHGRREDLALNPASRYARLLQMAHPEEFLV